MNVKKKREKEKKRKRRKNKKERVVVVELSQRKRWKKEGIFFFPKLFPEIKDTIIPNTTAKNLMRKKDKPVPCEKNKEFLFFDQARFYTKKYE